ncbi:MAG: CDP-glucose 4,6-dehydratase [Candidatus Lokiarchaeota archaeon]|nr:CDP-glucose 4,6-dehydratase [Candidatus Lokiarchaeota archaeon]
MRLFNNFFVDKKVLITGHTGFIGSWLTIFLKELGANIIGYALPPLTPNDNFVKTDLENRITSIIGDIRDYSNLEKIFNKYNPEIIYHLAAQPIVRKSYSIPKETYEINVGGTINILEIFRKSNNAKILINLTTDKVYQNLELDCGYCEDDRLGGYDPYSSSKACSELITSAYRNSFFNNVNNNDEKKISSVRFGNVIGGGDWQIERLVPDILRSINNNEKILIRNPFSVRPWQYVLEPLRGILVLAMKMMNGNNQYSSCWNFGPKMDEIYNVEELVENIFQYMGKDSHLIKKGSEIHLHETNNLLLNIDKAKKYLNWEPKLSFKEAIKMTCNWYKESKIDYDFDVRQIKEYINKIKE